jgi:hypothetical protein
VQSRDQEVSKQRIGDFKRETKIKKHTKGQGQKMSKEYKNINSDKFKSIGQKEVEQMNGTREMSNEERKQSRRKKKRVGGDAMRHR